MHVNQAREIGLRLRHIARDVEQTAIGSSRQTMYNELALAIREEADLVDEITANMGNFEPAKFRVTEDGNQNKG